MLLIEINNLKINVIIGTKEDEKQNKQEILLNISIKYNASIAAETDNLADALDYEEISNEIIDKVSKTNFNLLEKLCDFTLNIIMEKQGIAEASVKITKPNALDKASSVSLTMTKRK